MSVVSSCSKCVSVGVRAVQAQCPVLLQVQVQVQDRGSVAETAETVEKCFRAATCAEGFENRAEPAVPEEAAAGRDQAGCRVVDNGSAGNRFALIGSIFQRNKSSEFRR